MRLQREGKSAVLIWARSTGASVKQDKYSAKTSVLRVHYPHGMLAMLLIAFLVSGTHTTIRETALSR